ncbi:GumN family protein [Methylocella silvestris BL2]|uniref:GumN family protein n=1 Tax=Methylocella silvestris (strain DSM 15510 / CIP 108128 / LMG 27833 / NCIMB 13906 / BL2) TaxID=395965 RepID=B8EIJ1_METSB|nr:TraB/GumN family protein [Methylocella silvestris]ACK51310.1 GumN family protein [Methylocella silvestris BL2]
MAGGQLAAQGVRRRAIIAAILCFAASGARGACSGHDLFPLIEEKAPDAFAAIKAQAAETPFGRGTLFRLSDGANAPSYLFGTLHLADPRVTDFRPSVVEALAASKTLAVESIETGARLASVIRKDPKAMRAAVQAEGADRAADLLDRTDFAALRALVAAAGMKAAAAGELKPAVLALLLDLPACARTNGARPYADQRIAAMARARGLKVVGLETMIEQLDSLDGLPPDESRALLVSTLRQASEAEDVVETTIARYVEQETGALLAWMRSPDFIPGVAGAATPALFLDRLISGRNQRMVARATPLLAEGGVFIAVGAAHLPGEDGLLRLFEKQGFAVERVE